MYTIDENGRPKKSNPRPLALIWRISPVILLFIFCLDVFFVNRDPNHPHIITYLFDGLPLINMGPLLAPLLSSAVLSILLASFYWSPDGRRYMATRRIPYVAYALMILTALICLEITVYGVLHTSARYQDYLDYLAEHFRTTKQ